MLATTGWYCVLLPHFYSLTSRFSVVRRLNIYQGKLVNIPTSVVRGEPSDVLWLWENSWYFTGARGGGGLSYNEVSSLSRLVAGAPSQSPIFNNNVRAPQPSDFTVNFTPWEKLFWWLLLGLGRSDWRWWLSDLFSVYVHVETSKEVLIM